MKNNPSIKPSSNANLRVWAERRSEPDWDRFIAALVALALRRVEEREREEGRE